jgi:hypothetical protein
MGVSVAFDYGLWIARYPEFSNVDPLLVDQYFIEATMLHRNDGSGPVNNPSQQLLLLGMVTAHICQLNAPLNGQPSSTLVGRINVASEGTVTVSADYDAPASTQGQYFAQTKYGAAYWAASAPFRTMRYVPGPRRVTNPWYRGGIYW